MKGLIFSGGPAQILGIYEMSVQAALVSALREGAVFYDVGANSGFFSVLASRVVGKEGLVFAFEPVPENVALIEEHISLNGISNCVRIPSAVSEDGNLQELHIDPGDLSTPSFKYQEGRRHLMVPTLTLDDFAQRHRRPDLIKVDVEGAEVSVMSGADRLMAGTRAPNWIVEIHEPGDDKVICGLLERYGYKLSSLNSPRMRQKPYPRHVFAAK